MKFIGIIPARYDSTRFPGKPLVDIKGKTMIKRVYEQATQVLEKVVVATDDERIFQEVERFGGEVVMTKETHRSGTDRCEEAVSKLNLQENEEEVVVINIQGDEPFIKPEQIKELISCFDDPTAEISSLYRLIKAPEDVFNPNMPKLVLNNNSEAIYFSRSPIPCIKSQEKDNWIMLNDFFAHIGIYAYRLDILKKIVKLKEGHLEKMEGLEQLRWIENRFRVKMKKSDFQTHGIDTPEDLEKVLKLF
jgi:3-deoxy-manno-octulosonate cytidylyltransferase (CMP-KDO synthetase)